MAKKAGVSYSTIYKWRDKKSSPSLSLLESLCEVLDIHIVNLMVKDNELVYLPDEEKVLLDNWGKLRKDQKLSISTLIETLLKENQRNTKD